METATVKWTGAKNSFLPRIGHSVAFDGDRTHNAAPARWRCFSRRWVRAVWLMWF